MSRRRCFIYVFVFGENGVVNDGASGGGVLHARVVVVETLDEAVGGAGVESAGVVVGVGVIVVIRREDGVFDVALRRPLTLGQEKQRPKQKQKSFLRIYFFPP